MFQPQEIFENRFCGKRRNVSLRWINPHAGTLKMIGLRQKIRKILSMKLLWDDFKWKSENLPSTTFLRRESYKDTTNG